MLTGELLPELLLALLTAKSWAPGGVPGFLGAVLPVPCSDVAFAKSSSWKYCNMLPTTTGSHCVSRAAVFCCSPKLQVRFCMCIYIHFSDRFASKILVLIRRAANSCQPCPEGFTSKISHSFGQHLQPNGKKLQTKSRRCRLPITPTLQPCHVSPPSQDGMSASGPHGWRVTATAVPFQRSRPRRAGLDRERDEV